MPKRRHRCSTLKSGEASAVSIYRRIARKIGARSFGCTGPFMPSGVRAAMSSRIAVAWVAGPRFRGRETWCVFTERREMVVHEGAERSRSLHDCPVGAAQRSAALREEPAGHDEGHRR